MDLTQVEGIEYLWPFRAEKRNQFTWKDGFEDWHILCFVLSLILKANYKNIYFTASFNIECPSDLASMNHR